MTQKGVGFILVVLAVVSTERAAAPASYLFIMPSSAKASSTGKRKPTTRENTTNKKGKAKDPATLIKDFSTIYGKIMFSEDGIYQLTPAESARCGVLIQSQQWFLNKAVFTGLQDTFQFSHAFADDIQEEGAEIVAQGDEVEHAPLEVFVNLIDAVGNV
jgi:hypothetical protein